MMSLKRLGAAVLSAVSIAGVHWRPRFATFLRVRFDELAREAGEVPVLELRPERPLLDERRVGGRIAVRLQETRIDDRAAGFEDAPHGGVLLLQRCRRHLIERVLRRRRLQVLEAVADDPRGGIGRGSTGGRAGRRGRGEPVVGLPDRLKDETVGRDDTKGLA